MDEEDPEDNPHLAATFYRLNAFLDNEVRFLTENVSDEVVDAELALFRASKNADYGLSRAYQYILEQVRPERGYMIRLHEAMERNGIPFPLANDVADDECEHIAGTLGSCARCEGT